MWWLIVGLFFGVSLMIAAVAQVQKRRHPPFDPIQAPDDFPTSDDPKYADYPFTTGAK